MRQINRIFIHVSDSPDKMDIGIAEIRRWHTDPPPKGRGWIDCGYHFVVRRSGEVEQGRPVEQVGAHVEGHNKDSIGVVWVGRDRPTVVQYEALIEFVADLLNQYQLAATNVFGHHEANPGKTCPNIPMEKFRSDLIMRMANA